MKAVVQQRAEGSREQRAGGSGAAEDRGQRAVVQQRTDGRGQWCSRGQRAEGSGEAEGRGQWCSRGQRAVVQQRAEGRGQWCSRGQRAVVQQRAEGSGAAEGRGQHEGTYLGQRQQVDGAYKEVPMELGDAESLAAGHSHHSLPSCSQIQSG